MSAEARAVREALLTARQPQTLLFQALPVGLGYLDIEWSDERREAYLLALRQALIELRDAYANLLERIRRGLYEALHVSADHPQAREALASAAEACIPLSSDLRLEAFLRRLADQQLGDREWLESVGAVVVHKSPREWLDRDIVTLESGLAELSAQFRRLQDIALARGVRVGGGRVMRLGLTDSEGRELSQIVHGSPEEEAGVAKIVRELNAVLDSSTLQPQARLLAVAELARQLLDNTDQKVTDA
ncbi:MAG TPA: hypothetical protein GX714_15425 [Chloroflexi bacterium]|nr:hypothetical protein [Chloroflexota bacterium]